MPQVREVLDTFGGSHLPPSGVESVGYAVLRHEFGFVGGYLAVFVGIHSVHDRRDFGGHAQHLVFDQVEHVGTCRLSDDELAGFIRRADLQLHISVFEEIVGPRPELDGRIAFARNGGFLDPLLRGRIVGFEPRAFGNRHRPFLLRNDAHFALSAPVIESQFVFAVVADHQFDILFEVDGHLMLCIQAAGILDVKNDGQRSLLQFLGCDRAFEKRQREFFVDRFAADGQFHCGDVVLLIVDTPLDRKREVRIVGLAFERFGYLAGRGRVLTLVLRIVVAACRKGERQTRGCQKQIFFHLALMFGRCEVLIL